MAVGGQLPGASPSPSSFTSSPPPTSSSSVAGTESDIGGSCSLSGRTMSYSYPHPPAAAAYEDSPSRTVAPTTPSASRPNNIPKANRTSRSNSKHHLHRDHHAARNTSITTSGSAAAAAAAAATERPAVHSSILQPRVAVVLNVPPKWHPWLFALRLLSCLPAAWWGLPSALHLLLRFLPGPEHKAFSSLYQGEGLLQPYALMETAMATIWACFRPACFACGYLSFFFTDCLMSRWLLNYTPQATIVRLLTIDVINAYITLTTLSLCGGFQDPRLLLPGWIGIATTLTVCYHISNQRINIRKETSTSINVFSIASYISMVVLLVHMLVFQPDYPTMPVVVRGKRLWDDVVQFIAHIKGTIERERAEL